MAASDGRLVLSCTGCYTVSDFSSAAWNDANRRGLGEGNFIYWIVNAPAQLLAKVRVRRFYELELHKYLGGPIPVTGTDAALKQAFREAIPDLGPIGVPGSVASGYAGVNQAPAIQNWLHQYYSDTLVSQDAIVMLLFPNGSTCEYQLTDYTNQNFSFVSGSGHDVQGNPLDDYGNPVVVGPGGPMLTPDINITGAPGRERLEPIKLGGSSAAEIEAFVLSFEMQGKSFPLILPDGSQS